MELRGYGGASTFFKVLSCGNATFNIVVLGYS